MLEWCFTIKQFHRNGSNRLKNWLLEIDRQKQNGSIELSIFAHSTFQPRKPDVFYFKSCNVRQSALQKFLKISIKNSKCATSNKHIQDGRPGRYENRRGSKIKAKHHQKDPPPPRNENVRDVITQKA